jgi:hypothetical protein
VAGRRLGSFLITLAPEFIPAGDEPIVNAGPAPFVANGDVGVATLVPAPNANPPPVGTAGLTGWLEPLNPNGVGCDGCVGALDGPPKLKPPPLVVELPNAGLEGADAPKPPPLEGSGCVNAKGDDPGVVAWGC